MTFEEFHEKNELTIETIREEIDTLLNNADNENMRDVAIEILGELLGFDQCLYQCIKHKQLLEQVKDIKKDKTLHWCEQATLNSVISLIENLKK